jgi:hypothetical protein
MNLHNCYELVVNAGLFALVSGSRAAVTKRRNVVVASGGKVLLLVMSRKLPQVVMSHACL